MKRFVPSRPEPLPLLTGCAAFLIAGVWALHGVLFAMSGWNLHQDFERAFSTGAPQPVTYLGIGDNGVLVLSALTFLVIFPVSMAWFVLAGAQIAVARSKATIAYFAFVTVCLSLIWSGLLDLTLRSLASSALGNDMDAPGLAQFAEGLTDAVLGLVVIAITWLTWITAPAPVLTFPRRSKAGPDTT